MQTTLTFDYPAGIDDAIKQLEEMRPAAPAATASLPTPVTSAQVRANVAEVVRMHQLMDANESRRFLEALTEQPLTFAELAQRMKKDDGTTHSNASMRAIHRNVRRQELTLIKRGVIADHIVQSTFDNYDAEQAGRYYVTPDALAALDPHLGR
jgi:hypothetical protein